MKLYLSRGTFPEKAGAHRAGLELLADAVRREYGFVSCPAIAFGDHGKPYFPGFPHVHFNISHCSGLVVCGLSGKPLGVDAEPLGMVRERVLQRAFSAKEQELVSTSTNPDEMFYRLWTLKEAYGKALGVGLAYPFAETSFLLQGDAVLAAPAGYRFVSLLWNGFLLGCCFDMGEELRGLMIVEKG